MLYVTSLEFHMQGIFFFFFKQGHGKISLQIGISYGCLIVKLYLY